MRTLRILIADDHEVVRKGLRGILEAQEGWQVVAEAGTGRRAVELTEQHKPDVVVLDVTMPELNGLDATRQILQIWPQAEVLILTVHDSEQIEREVLQAGARGYVLKSDAVRDLVAAVDTLGQHRPFFTPRVAEMLLAGYLRPESRPDPVETPRSRLSPREVEVLQLLAEGKSNKEVAVTLNISVKTAETHRSNIMHKLNLRSLSDLVRYAVRNQIIEA